MSDDTCPSCGAPAIHTVEVVEARYVTEFACGREDATPTVSSPACDYIAKLREQSAHVVCLALGCVDEHEVFHEPDEVVCGDIYAAIDGDKAAEAEIAIIGRALEATNE